MLRTLTTASLCLAIAAPLAAQAGGSANAQSPTCSQSIKFSGGASLSVEYKALTPAKGRTLEAMKDESMRDRLNSSFARSPLGKATVTGTITLGGKKVVAGDYKFYFTCGEGMKWSLVMAGDDATHTWELDLKKNDEEHGHSRLAVVIVAGDDAFKATMYLGFNKQNGKVEIAAERPAARRRRGGGR